MEFPFEDVLFVIAGTLAWLLLLAALSRFNRRRGRNGLPVNWGGLLLVAFVSGIVTAIGYSAYLHQAGGASDNMSEVETAAVRGAN